MTKAPGRRVFLSQTKPQAVGTDAETVSSAGSELSIITETFDPLCAALV